ncbi:MAG: 3'-5' exonuclease [Desulfocapsaceae bacterium]|nr:3'-5' exonuclease [Desulfocapsaceae bacterium]
MAPLFSRSQMHEHIAVDWPVIMAARQKEAKDIRLKNFYSAWRLHPKTTLADASFVALDFETTGLNPEIDDIISIGLVPFDLQRIVCHEATQWLVHPRRELTEQTVVIHGITHTDINDSPDLNVILDELLTALAGKIIVVHYHPIERGFLNTALKRRIGEGIQFPVIDTMIIEYSIRQKGVRPLWRQLRGQQPISVRLANSRERYGLPAYQPHHALTDALATAELLQAQVAHHFSTRAPLAEFLV